MLRIDRVRAEMHLLPGQPAPDAGEPAPAARLDPETLRPMLLEILREELRALQRRGTL